MVDLASLYRRLERATFSQREQIAEEVARETPRDQLATLVRALEHPHQAVRLGAIEILRRGGCREAMRRLLQHARDHDGDDRVFALRALASLAEPGDDFLASSVRGWLTSSDPFVAAHAQRLAATLALPGGPQAAGAPRRVPAAEGAGAAGAAGAAHEPLDRLVVRLFGASKGSERITAVEAIERRGPHALAATAKLTLQKGGADLVALVCRAVIRQVAALPADAREALPPALEAARRRLGDAPIAAAAIDDALLALDGGAPSPALLARIGELEAPQLAALARRLCARPPEEVALHAPALLAALGRAPALWEPLGPALAHAAAHVRDGARAELRGLAERAIDELRRGAALPAAAVVAVCRVLARIAEPGEPLPRQLRAALEGLASADAARALCELCARLATEEAAAALLALARDPLPDVRACAREALAAWQSPWVRIDGLAVGAEPAVSVVPAAPALVASYADEQGQPLARRGDRLVGEASGPAPGPAPGDEYVLDGRGRPVRAGETEAGGCLCCAPPRALVRRRREGLRCPSSWESHLREGGRTLLERDHPLGRCKRCDSVRPRVREGTRAICLDCGAGLPAGRAPAPGAPGPDALPPPMPSEHGRIERAGDLPRPPSREELEHVAPAIRAALEANVFLSALLRARDGHESWNGSGVVIARDGDHVAILTNRHVVESDDGGRLCAMTAVTVGGEAVPARAVWRARRGVDLALLEARVARPDAIGVMPLGTGAVLVGAEVFAIGNPLGLAWSYTRGTLSAIRHWTTAEGESVRVLQTDANIAPGSSGGGLFHGDGHLLGVISFLRQGPTGGAAHFALSVDAIRRALAREGVRWRGRALAEPPGS